MENSDRIKEITKEGRINNKEECYLLYEAGIFGNKALTWNSLQEIRDSGWKGEVCMRGRLTQIERGKVVYNLNLNEVPRIIEQFKIDGIPESNIGFNQSMPDEHLVIQGEVMKTWLGLSLMYTTKKEPMNSALKKESLYAEGLKAKLLLENSMCPSSYSDLEALFDWFPDSAVEFSTYNISVGNIPNRNTVIWEVRNY
jgi:hypothetical protein